MFDFWQRYIGFKQCQFMIGLYMFQVFTGLTRTKQSNNNYFDWFDSCESKLLLNNKD